MGDADNRSAGENGRNAAAGHEPGRVVRPDAALSARQALDAVLSALAGGGRAQHDHGAGVVYAFASDRMRAAIGGLDAFQRALANERYAPLVYARERETESFEQRDDAARATVRADGGRGEPARFTVALARSAHGDRKGCWLLSGIARQGVDL